jgi:hypothetical protein
MRPGPKAHGRPRLAAGWPLGGQRGARPVGGPGGLASARCAVVAAHRVLMSMTQAEREFLALDGFIQWTSAAITQAERLAGATISVRTPDTALLTLAALRTETDFFVAAAWKVLEFRKWVSALGLCRSIDFSEIDKFDTPDTRDLRNMREHVVDYFQGRGNYQERWLVETPEFRADASTLVDNIIGGRLDYKAFSEAAKRLLPQLLEEPNPNPRNVR